jgi:hypothetical protein
MSISVIADSRAYMHSGGSKYYRLISIAITNRDNRKSCYALVTNYGAFKAEKGDIHGHKPIHGGTSSIEYFDNPTSLANKLNSESIRRRSRGYESLPEACITYVENEADEALLQEVLRRKAGIIAGHHSEILMALGMKDATVTAPGLGDVLAKAKADVESKLPASARKSAKAAFAASAKTETAPSAPKMPEIDRGEVWGSW